MKDKDSPTEKKGPLVVNLLKTLDRERKTSLRDKLVNISQALDKYFLKNYTDNELKGVIVAPDYYLCAPSEFITQKDWETFKSVLKDLSAQYPNVLIVPGTGVVSQGQMKVSEARKLVEENWKFLDGLNRSKKISPVGYKNVDDFLSAKLESFKFWEKETPDGLVEGVSNTTAIFYGGDCQREYRKVIDNLEFGDGHFSREVPGHSESYRQVFIPDNQIGSLKIGGNTISIEICADHSAGIAKFNQLDKADISIILSYGNYLVDSNLACIDGGLVIELDSKKETEHTNMVTLKIKEPPVTRGPIKFTNPNKIHCDLIPYVNTVTPSTEELFKLSDDQLSDLTVSVKKNNSVQQYKANIEIMHQESILENKSAAVADEEETIFASK